VDDGVLLISTPNGAFVATENPVSEVLAALSCGDHVMLLEQDGLATMLRRAGFPAVDVRAERATLRAVASPTSAGLGRARPLAQLDIGLLSRYCDWRAGEAPAGSALQLGMAARAMRFALHAADLTAAAEARPSLRQAMFARSCVDLDDPAATARRATQEDLPLVVADAHFSCGLLDLLHNGRPDLAAEHFSAAAATAGTARAGRNPAPKRLALSAIGHEALALARSDPARAPEALLELHAAVELDVHLDVPEIEALFGRVFTELVAGGHYDAADRVRPLVSKLAPRRIDETSPHVDEIRRTGLDTVFSLAMLHLQRGDAAAAAAHFALCGRLTEEQGDDHADNLRAAAVEHEVIALSRLAGRVLVPGPPAVIQ
ncbi:MAG: hypothetical protein ACRD0U_11680, partial [Acidimicrobiales bacterium]